MVLIDLPAFDERLQMIGEYMEKYLLNPTSGSRRITVHGADEALLRAVATQTEGYSGREISKLAIAWQAAAYGSADATIDAKMLFEVLEETKQSKHQKMRWLGKEGAKLLVRDSLSPSV